MFEKLLSKSSLFILSIFTIGLFLIVSIFAQQSAEQEKELTFCKVRDWKCAKKISVLCDCEKNPLYLTSEIMRKNIVHKTDINRPSVLGKNNIYGILTAKVLVDEKGKIICLEILESHPLAKTPAEHALRQWELKPFEYNEKPVSVVGYLSVEYDFRL